MWFPYPVEFESCRSASMSAMTSAADGLLSGSLSVQAMKISTTLLYSGPKLAGRSGREPSFPSANIEDTEEIEATESSQLLSEI